MAPEHRRAPVALPLVGDGPAALRADCANCFGLCCVALTFARSTDFAVDKAAGRPCTNLREDYRCGIHGDLRNKGFQGCTVYDCFGAGQHVSQHTFDGRSWREDKDAARQMFEVFPVMRQLHELLWYLTDALSRPRTAPITAELKQALAETERLAAGTPQAVADVDVAAHRQDVNVLLLRTSELVRKGNTGKKKQRRGADLVGARLRSADLKGADLRGAYLIGADLRDADLREADLIGADFRDTDLRGADLTDALFLTRSQVNAARGDARTKLPKILDRPSHWTQA
ncbi:pentapeptide repeat-containing protein [Streptomyces alfalfae]|uniref:Oxetanocin A resistance protein n=1 Tax=Streptomyces alfalfae TaxID=1642299 RepID=A0ABM6GY48_9ACTN|nr:pentapeptide repeat-containing protein [Streptomyces alfalfae]AYA19233.1 pentapeptide repeat-containing protein [Streptomyces fradiae]APY88819.1 oxetanocin A resistance protein [Streptomyces alfalfae]QUI31237.1 pentapeptide repeat-containing protein [Streptomyces alfalfae]RXX36058.1 pentapeptide repeat-containing protein [Streptomyces alfalfae]RZN00372.1 pentapeptide repeat-containing protein [Streptomyces alfalfae]